MREIRRVTSSILTILMNGR